MQVLLTGGTGFIGQALVPALLRQGYRALILSREARQDLARCRYVRSLDDIEDGEAIDAVINLAGASLAARRWTVAYKQEIINSRLYTTERLSQLMSRLLCPPQVFLSASAIGIYGHGEGQALVESSQPLNTGFAQGLCADWEAAATAGCDPATRLCLLRLGVVLDAGGGALAEMARSFRFGVASWRGSGYQFLGWIHRADAVAAILFRLDREDAAGAFNLTAPQPVTGRELCAALRRHHSTFLTAGVPGPVLRLLLGEMAGELLLNGQRVLPQRLEQAGFAFQYPDIEGALGAVYNA